MVKFPEIEIELEDIKARSLRATLEIEYGPKDIDWLLLLVAKCGKLTINGKSIPIKFTAIEVAIDPGEIDSKDIEELFPVIS